MEFQMEKSRAALKSSVIYHLYLYICCDYYFTDKIICWKYLKKKHIIQLIELIDINRYSFSLKSKNKFIGRTSFGVSFMIDRLDAILNQMEKNKNEPKLTKSVRMIFLM